MFLRAWATCLETGGGYPAHEGAGAACRVSAPALPEAPVRGSAGPLGGAISGLRC